MKRMLCALIALCLVCVPLGALADSVEGSWSGSGRAMGRKVGISCYFNGSGGFSASGAGMSVSGSYSVSDGGVTLSAKGTSIFLSLSSSENGQSLSGSGRYRGIKGTIYLSRSGAAAVARSTPYGSWHLEQNGVEYRLALYAGGYLYWSEVVSDEADERAFENLREGFEDGSITDMEGVLAAIEAGAAPKEYIAKMKAANGKLSLEPLTEDAPTFWEDFAEEGGYALPYKLQGGKLLLLEREGDYQFSFAKAGATDEKPAAAIFRPYVTFERGDQGEGVKQMQEKLIALEHLNDKADGSFGPKTEKAVAAFEAAYGLAADGKADPEMMEALYEE